MVSQVPFGRKATGGGARLRAVLAGTSKSGKSYGGLTILTTLRDTLNELNVPIRGNGKIIGIDSEYGRLNEHYGRMFDFDVHEIYDFSAKSYANTLKTAIDNDYSFILMDQITNEWAGKGGVLEVANAMQNAAGSRYNSFTIWGPVNPIHQEFMDAISMCPVHIICTMRSKQDYVMEEYIKDNGQKSHTVKKLGLAPVQRDGVEYEFDIYGQINQDHVLTIETRGELSRYLGDRKFLPGPHVDEPGEVGEIGKIVGKWIAGSLGNDSGGYASREQISEIRRLGDELPVDWSKLFRAFNISSLNTMTPEAYEKIKKDLAKNLENKKSKLAEKTSKEKKGAPV
jgi:hypothetical protein